MSPEQELKLNKIMEDMLLQLEQEGEGRIRYCYSGRGMYGSTCVGFVTGSKPFNIGLKLGMQLEELADDFADEDEKFHFVCRLKDSRSDSMGLDTIIYWERFDLPYPEGDEDCDEYEEDEE